MVVGESASTVDEAQRMLAASRSARGTRRAAIVAGALISALAGQVGQARVGPIGSIAPIASIARATSFALDTSIAPVASIERSESIALVTSIASVEPIAPASNVPSRTSIASTSPRKSTGLRTSTASRTSPAPANVAVASALQAQPAPPPIDRSSPGPFAVGRRSALVPRAEGEPFSALLFYPAAAESGGTVEAPVDDAPIATDGAPFAGVVFGHGFAQEPSRYAGLLAHMASWGYILVAPESHTGLVVDHAAYAADFSAALGWLEQVGDAAPDDPAPDDPAHAGLGSAVDGTRLGVAGHSMGGGAALLAAAADPRVSAWIVLAPAETSPSAVAAMADVTAVGAVLAGDEDVITPLPDHARPIHEAGRDARLLTVLRGGSHCGFQDVPFPLACQEGSLPWAKQLALTRNALVAFLDLHLGVVDPLGAGSGSDSEDREAGDTAVHGPYGISRATWRHVWGPDAVADPVVDVDPRPGISVHAEPFVAQAHGIVRAPVRVARGPDAQGAPIVELHADAGAWPVLTPRLRTPPLAAGESYTLTVELAVPLRDPGAVETDVDEVLVSTWIDGEPLQRVRAWTRLRIERTPAAPDAGRVWLPWAGRGATGAGAVGAGALERSLVDAGGARIAR